MIDAVKSKVYELLKNENSGHGMDHIERVLRLSLLFAENEGADKDITSLIALLHEVDDYKIFGKENATNLTNAHLILNQVDASDDIKNRVIGAIQKIGYKKRLEGTKPDTIEGMVVSDADMCDATGADGIVRALKFSLAHNDDFFNKDVFPKSDYTFEKETVSTSVNHMFEKLLPIKKHMLTESGRKEAEKRRAIMIDFLRNFFEEENVPEWSEYLESFIKNLG
jgi:uncharacterized protein